MRATGLFGNGPRPDARVLKRGRVASHKVVIRFVVGAPAREKQPCPTPFDCTASWQRSLIRSIAQADAMAKWLPPNGFTCTVHHLDAKVGGTYRMSFRNFTTGMSHSFGGKYLEL